MIEKWLVKIKDLLLVEIMFKKEKMKKNIVFKMTQRGHLPYKFLMSLFFQVCIIN